MSNDSRPKSRRPPPGSRTWSTTDSHSCTSWRSRAERRGRPPDFKMRGPSTSLTIPGVTYVIAQPCIDVLDRTCVDQCPVDCIYEGSRAMYIHPDECVDCGACVSVCPVEAIFYEEDVPAQ